VYGSIAPGLPLQCTGAKTATCLTPAQVTATKKIAQAAHFQRDRIRSPDGTPLSGYPFDAASCSLRDPDRDHRHGDLGAGNIGLGSGQLPLFWFATPDPTYNPLTVKLRHRHPPRHAGLSGSEQLDRHQALREARRQADLLPRTFRLRPAVPYTLKYFRTWRGATAVSSAGEFMKLYLVPNMGHCSGNASTDNFDMLTPMVN